MPNYDFSCPSGHQFEKYIPLSEWKDKLRIPCEGLVDTPLAVPEGAEPIIARTVCTELASQAFLPRGTNSTIEPFVYYLNAQGEIRVPGQSNGPIPPGHTRCEVTTLGELRSLEARMSREERAKISQRREVEDYYEAQERTELRMELRSAMERMSQHGRDFARYAIEQTNKRRNYQSFDPGLHLSILHNDQKR